MSIPIDQDFYYPKDLHRYPLVTQQVVKRLLLRIAELIYPNEYKVDPIKTVQDRIFIADIEAGGDVLSGESFEKYKTMFPAYPFTAYNITEAPTVKNENFQYSHTSGVNRAFDYFDTIKSKGVAIPLTFTLTTYTFFSDVEDYYRWASYANWEAVNFSKASVPLLLGSREDPQNPPVQVNYVFSYGSQVNKGNLANGFEEYLRMNDIWDLSVSFNVTFYDLIFDTFGIYPVDDMKLFLRDMDSPTIFSKETPDGIISPQPVISNFTPVNNSINVPVADPVVITFSDGMIRASVEEGLSISPPVDVRLNWDDWSAVLTIEPWIAFAPNTEYTIKVEKGINAWGQEIDKPYEFKFTTGP